MAVVWWFIVGRRSDIMHPGGQWAWLMSLMIIGNDVSNQRGDVGVIWHDISGEDVIVTFVTLCIPLSHRVLVKRMMRRRSKFPVSCVPFTALDCGISPPFLGFLGLESLQ